MTASIQKPENPEAVAQAISPLHLCTGTFSLHYRRRIIIQLQGGICENKNQDLQWYVESGCHAA